ncbi:class I adenylate-forming enzyme family protein [Actinospica sp.]|uniref:class I adenylate-forming enzyme family protein n=1 Tax=Actinospica sp. TaxID=1872142 RepID=UPI002CA5924B|nr:class I adenylate-forming enzyme family protein [Actinospica sp.]HWG25513.1 class I adenylate-forming enzyme family protein [Actinospica sp.]
MSMSSATPSGLLGELLKHQLGRAPLGTALQYGSHKLTWRKLDSRVRRAATGLRAAMVRPGDRIGVLSPNHPACIEALFAAALTGTTAVLVNWWLPEEEIAEILRVRQVKVLFVAVELNEMLERIRPQLDDLDSVVMIGRPKGEPYATDDYELWLELHETGEGMYEAAQFHPHVDDPILQVEEADGEHLALSHRTLQLAVAAEPPAVGESKVVSEPLFRIAGMAAALHGLREGLRTILEHSEPIEGI